MNDMPPDEGRNSAFFFAQVAREDALQAWNMNGILRRLLAEAESLLQEIAQGQAGVKVPPCLRKEIELLCSVISEAARASLDQVSLIQMGVRDD